jgi:hypothetical protein
MKATHIKIVVADHGTYLHVRHGNLDSYENTLVVPVDVKLADALRESADVDRTLVGNSYVTYERDFSDGAWCEMREQKGRPIGGTNAS